MISCSGTVLGCLAWGRRERLLLPRLAASPADSLYRSITAAGAVSCGLVRWLSRAFDCSMVMVRVFGWLVPLGCGGDCHAAGGDLSYLFSIAKHGQTAP